jgi:hypothetical protein
LQPLALPPGDLFPGGLDVTVENPETVVQFHDEAPNVLSDV